jgi:uncharacterized protein (DUF2252 family)
MRDFADMDVMDIWYARIDDSDFLATLTKGQRSRLVRRIAKATARSSSELVYPKLVDDSEERSQIRNAPPTIFHPDESRHPGFLDAIRDVLAKYKETLPEDRRVLFDRFELMDIAVKVVGIGSVGTICMVALFMSIVGRPFFLQVKEANASVLEPHAGSSVYPHHGQRFHTGGKRHEAH